MTTKALKASENFSSRSLLPMISTAASPVDRDSMQRKMSTVSSLKASEYDFEISEIYDHVDALPDIKKIAKSKKQSKSSSNLPLSLSNIYSVTSSNNRLNRIMKQKTKCEIEARESKLLSKSEEIEDDSINNEFYLKLTTPKTFYYFPPKRQLPLIGSTKLDESSNHSLDLNVFKITSRATTEIKENLLKENSRNAHANKSVKHLFFPQLSDRSAKKNARIALKSCLMERPNGSYFLQSCSYLNIKSN
jgi:hypothetical protein